MAYSGSGSGTQASPYIITTPAQLTEVSDYPSAWWELGNDIDLDVSPYNTGDGWAPLCSAIAFSGNFNGAGYTIDNLFIDRSSTDEVGLFSAVGSGALIRNLTLTNGDVTGQYYVGGLLGRVYSSGSLKINNCSVSGTIEGTDDVGILIGFVHGTANIRNCYTSGSATGRSSIGGLIGGIGYGFGVGSAEIKNCYSTAEVSSSTGPAGSFIGAALSDSVFTDCYATGELTGTYGTGFCGYGKPTTTNCYFDITTTGTIYSTVGEGKTTAEMKTQDTFVDWEWDKAWDISTSYPFLLDLEFDVLTEDPTLTTITPTTIVLNGTYDNDYDILYKTRDSCGFVYDTESHNYPGDVVPASSDYANTSAADTTSTYTFSKTLTGMQEGQTYYYRSYWIDEDDTIVYSRETSVITYTSDDTVILSTKYDSDGKFNKPAIKITFE